MKAPSTKDAIRKWKELRFYLLVVAIAYANTLLLGAVSTSLRSNLQNIVFDQYQRWRPRASGLEQPVRIIDIDDESIRRVGQWPWPRQRMADIVDVLFKANVAAVTFDVLFSEKDRASFDNLSRGPPHAVALAGHEEDSEARSDGDAAFAHSIANRPVVLGDLFTRNGVVVGEIPAKGGFAIIGDAPIAYLPHLSGALTPLPILMERAAGIGFVNWQPDSDRVVRRVPLLLAVNGQMQPSLAIETLRVAQGASTYLIKSGGSNGETVFGQGAGVIAIKDGDLVIPTQPGGDIRAYFANSNERLSTPAWKIFDQGADLSDFAGKIVVVGASASMLADVVATPLNPSTPGVEAQAQLIEQILGGVELLRPDWAPGAELLAAAALSLMLVVTVAHDAGALERAFGRACCGGDGGRKLVGIHPARRPARPGLAQFFLWRSVSCGRCSSVQPETAPSGRDSFGLWKICLAGGRGATGRAPRIPSTWRPTAQPHRDVLRLALFHHLVGGLFGDRTYRLLE